MKIISTIVMLISTSLWLFLVYSGVLSSFNLYTLGVRDKILLGYALVPVACVLLSVLVPLILMKKGQINFALLISTALLILGVIGVAANSAAAVGS